MYCGGYRLESLKFLTRIQDYRSNHFTCVLCSVAASRWCSYAAQQYYCNATMESRPNLPGKKKQSPWKSSHLRKRTNQAHLYMEIYGWRYVIFVALSNWILKSSSLILLGQLQVILACEQLSDLSEWPWYILYLHAIQAQYKLLLRLMDVERDTVKLRLAGHQYAGKSLSYDELWRKEIITSSSQIRLIRWPCWLVSWNIVNNADKSDAVNWWLGYDLGLTEF